MKIVDWNIVFSSIGKQQNFILILSIIAIIIFSITLYIEKTSFYNFFIELIRWVSLILSIYFLAYAIILTKIFSEKYFSKKR
jgi:hypothetical protein